MKILKFIFSGLITSILVSTIYIHFNPAPKPTLEHNHTLNIIEEVIYTVSLSLHYDNNLAQSLITSTWYHQHTWIAQLVFHLAQKKMPPSQMMGYLLMYGTKIAWSEDMTTYLNQIPNNNTIKNSFHEDYCFYHLFYEKETYFSPIEINIIIFNSLTHKLNTYNWCKIDIPLLGLPPQ